VLREVEAGSLVAVPLDTDELVRPLGIIHRRGKELSSTAQRFIEMLQRAATHDNQQLSRSSPEIDVGQQAAADDKLDDSRPVIIQQRDSQHDDTRPPDSQHVETRELVAELVATAGGGGGAATSGK
jgi:hypothetical protein